MSAQQVADKAIKYGMKEVDVKVRGPGSGRESAITALAGCGAEDQVDRRRDSLAPQWLPAQEKRRRV